MKKRILGVILAVIMTVGMVVSAIPAVSAASGKMPFTDVKEGQWFHDAIRFVWERDLMNGMTDTTFGPNQSMTRAQIVMILSRMSGDNVKGMSSQLKFTDVKKSAWYADAIGWAVKNGIATGMSDTKFQPDSPVLRQEFAAFFVRYMNYKGITLPDEGEAKAFPDQSKFPAWAKDHIATLQKAGLVKGDDKGNYNPKNKMTRAEIATVTMRFVEAVEAQQGDRPLKEIVEAYLDENLCIAHTKLDVTFNYSGSVTEENLAALLKSEMGLGDEVTVTFNCDFDGEFKGADNYGGMGDSGAGVLLPSAQNFFWPTSATSVTFKNEETGDAYTTEIDFSFHKVLCSAEIKGGKYANGVKSLCPDDWDKTFHGAEASLEAFKGTADSPYDFGSALTVGAIEEAARAATGLKNETKYPFFITGFDPTKTEEGMTVNFGFINRDKGIPENVLDLIYVETFIKGAHRTLAEKVDDYLDEYNCIAHDKLDYTFNYSSSLTAESLGALLIKEIGLPDTVEVDFDCEFNEFKDGYSQSGDGGYGSAPAGNAFHWADTVDVTFTDTATGEEYAVAIDFSLRKVLCSGELGYPGGVKSPCHEDWDGAFHSLENKLAPFKNSGDDVLEYDGDLTPEGLEEKARELTGLTGRANELNYPFFIVGYEADK
ncbi:MAG: S-layer homology domain-containing protein, partial [Clostridia bacterium]|nr:S-layer homology domain-containing protein [Clostridia bacterium]